MVYSNDGVAALYRGILPQVLRVGPGGASMLLLYEKFFNLLKEKFL